MGEVKRQFVCHCERNYITLKIGGIRRRYNLREINYFEADDDCTKIFFTDTTPVQLVNEAISDIEKRLQKTHCARCHRSFIINLDWVKEYIISGGPFVKMENDKPISVSKTYQTYIENRLDDLPTVSPTIWKAEKKRG